MLVASTLGETKAPGKILHQGWFENVDKNTNERYKKTSLSELSIYAHRG